MKRMMITLWLTCLACLGMMAQQPLSEFLNVSGKMKSYYSWRDEIELEKGSSCVLQFITKLKKYEMGEGAYQAVMYANEKQFYIPLDKVADYFEPDVWDKNRFWLMTQLGKYPGLEKRDELAALRKEQSLEADRYVSELEKAHLFYDDAAIEDYLQCLMISIVPDNQIFGKQVKTPVVRLLRSEAPDMMLLGNGTLLVSTGLLAILDSEDEIISLFAREVSHQVLDHALITVKQNIARANRAAFWGAVLDGVVAATETTLYERYDHYRPGLFFDTNAVIQAFVNEKIANRMGLDYAPKMEWEADGLALSFMEVTGKNKDALASALHKLNDYYQRVNDVDALSKYGNYGTLGERLQKLGKPALNIVDRAYLKRMSSVVSYEAAMQDYNQRYHNSRLLAMKNVDNNLASADDYLMVARSIMKQSNTPESNAECLMYLDKAELVAVIENVNITKMRILLMLRGNLRVNAIDMIKKYQAQLDVLFQQPHTEEDAEWITAEQLWAEKQLEQMYLH